MKSNDSGKNLYIRGIEEAITVRQHFAGYYFKHQKGDHTLCIIAGCTNKEQFIQVITEEFSVEVPYSEGNYFSRKGIRLNIQTPQITLTGTIRYVGLSPIKYDIMGPFSCFPMECRHGIVSMNHQLNGKVVLNGDVIDFTGGVGYIENDSGCSFPASYIWVQANDFQKQKCSIMAAVATIPFCGFRFRGCICVIQYKGREYRLATYLGVRVILCTKNRILLKQGKYFLEIRIKGRNAKSLSAPKNGDMMRTIWECAACPAEFIFYERGKCVFRLRSERASFEWEMS